MGSLSVTGCASSTGQLDHRAGDADQADKQCRTRRSPTAYRTSADAGHRPPEHQSHSRCPLSRGNQKLALDAARLGEGLPHERQAPAAKCDHKHYSTVQRKSLAGEHYCSYRDSLTRCDFVSDLSHETMERTATYAFGGSY